MKLPRKLALAASTSILLAGLVGCSSSPDDDVSTPVRASAGTSVTTVAESADGLVTTLDDTHADSNDGDYDAASATAISLADGATSVDAGSDGGAVDVDGDVVTITAPGTYLASGTLSDGQLVVASDADGKVRIVLDGADITSSTTSPLLVEQSDETVVILADGSANSLSDGAGSGVDDEVEDAPNATLFSHDDLTIAGTGSLVVQGISADGITSKDGLVILSGTVTVVASDDGIRGKDYLVVEDGTISVDAAGDAMKADNDIAEEAGSIVIDGGELTLASGDDGVHAEGALTITAGTITVTDSVEGLEAPVIDISGGDIDVTSSDDGLNGAGDLIAVAVSISGGTLHVDADGDGLDANGDLTISGGTVTVDGPEQNGNGALDVDGTFLVTGGVLAAAGSSGMAIAPSADSDQAWLQVTLDSTVAAGQAIVLVDESGTTVATYVTSKATASLVVSSAAIEQGATYTVLVGEAGDRSAGWTDGGVTDGLTETTTAVAGESTGGGFGGPTGQGGQGGPGGPTGQGSQGDQGGPGGEPPSGGRAS